MVIFIAEAPIINLSIANRPKKKSKNEEASSQSEFEISYGPSPLLPGFA